MARYFGNIFREPMPHTTPWTKEKELNNPHPKKSTGYELFDAVELLGVLYLGYQLITVGLPWIFKNIWAGVGSIIKKGADTGAQLFGFKNAEAFVNWAQGKHNVKIQIFADQLLVTLDDEPLSRVTLPKENFTFQPISDAPSVNMPFSSQFSYKGIEETETAVICYDLLLLLDYYASSWTWYGQATGRQKVEWILHTNLVCTENTNQLAYFSLWYYWEFCKQTFEKAGYKVNHKLYTDCNGTFHYLDTQNETFYISYKTIGR